MNALTALSLLVLGALLGYALRHAKGLEREADAFGRGVICGRWMREDELFSEERRERAWLN